MKSIQSKYEDFRDYNKQHKIVIGEWLDADKHVLHSNDGATFLRYTFENNTIRTLHKDVVSFARKRGFKPRWRIQKCRNRSK